MDRAQQLPFSVILPNYTTKESHGDVPLQLESKAWAHCTRQIPVTEKKKSYQYMQSVHSTEEKTSNGSDMPCTSLYTF